MRLGRRLWFCVAAALLALPSFGASAPGKAAIASAHPLATQAGIRILEQGGNAFDAAITVAAVLGVVEPYSAGIGGGGFWLLQRGNQPPVFIDARETAPSAAKADLYVNAKGEVDRDLAINTALSAGIPGQPAAFVHIAKGYGSLPLQKTLQPAIDAARQGFPINPVYQALASFRAPVLQRYADSQRIFLNEGKPFTPDTLIRQPELATTLERLAAHGFDGFYKGELARKLVDGVNAGGGIWTLADLGAYRVIEREPIVFTYQGNRIWSAPPPSSGGIALAQNLTPR